MNVLWYRDYTGHNDDSVVWRTLKSALKKHPDVMLRVEVFLKRVQELDSLDAQERSGEIASLGGGLAEMRIPKTRQCGVAAAHRSNNTTMTLSWLPAWQTAFHNVTALPTTNDRDYTYRHERLEGHAVAPAVRES